MLSILTANIIAGISVFGIENHARTHVFLANEGVQPGLVWLVKTSIWLAAMFVLWVLTVLVSACLRWATSLTLGGPLTSLSMHFYLSVGGVVLTTLAIPILCGMVIRRGITAGTVTLLVLILVLPPLFGLFAMEMLPSVFLWLVPLALLAVSFAWSPDWMLDRPGARRWVKLAVLLAGSFGAVFAAYVAVRVEGVPTLDPVRDAEIFTFTTPTSVPAAENAAGSLPPGERSQSRRCRARRTSGCQDGWDPKAEDVIAWYRENAKAPGD